MTPVVIPVEVQVKVDFAPGTDPDRVADIVIAHLKQGLRRPWYVRLWRWLRDGFR